MNHPLPVAIFILGSATS